MEKARIKFEFASETWEKFQGGDNNSVASFATEGTKRSNRMKGFVSKVQLLKQRIQHDLKIGPKSEDEARQKASTANALYKQNLQLANTARQSYIQHHLPRFVRALKEANDNCDEGINKYLLKYAKSVEDMVMVEATTVSPLEAQEIGLVQIIESIDSNTDFETFINAFSNGRKSLKVDSKFMKTSVMMESPRMASVAAPLDISPIPPVLNPLPPNLKFSSKFFGGLLVDMMEANPEANPVPRIVSNCIEYIEATGLNEEGLYRMSGSGSAVNKLRTCLEANPNFALEDVVQDIHTVTGVLKLFFRELKEPLFPRQMFPDVMIAISNSCRLTSEQEDERLGLVKIHEQINLLHDANYATLKVIASHLSRFAID